MFTQTTTAPTLARTSYAAYPVWKGSRRGQVKFAPLGPSRAESKRAAVRLFHAARRFEQRTRRPGHQDGAVTRNGILILHAMLWDCLDHITGRLDPCYATIARLANMSVRSVARGIKALAKAGILNWIRRCSWDDDTGQLAQDSNAYAVLPPSQWHGFTAPAPEPGTIGEPERVPDVLETAADHLRAGNRRAAQSALDLAEPGTLGHALAQLGRRFKF